MIVKSETIHQFKCSQIKYKDWFKLIQHVQCILKRFSLSSQHSRVEIEKGHYNKTFELRLLSL